MLIAKEQYYEMLKRPVAHWLTMLDIHISSMPKRGKQ